MNNVTLNDIGEALIALNIVIENYNENLESYKYKNIELIIEKGYKRDFMGFMCGTAINVIVKIDGKKVAEDYDGRLGTACAGCKGQLLALSSKILASMRSKK